MDAVYPAPPPYSMYEQSQWSDEMKAHYMAERNGSAIGDGSLDPTNIPSHPSASSIRRPSLLKIEDELSTGAQGWHSRMSESQIQLRHFSQPQLMNGHNAHVIPMQDSNFMATLAPHPQWSNSQSGSSTPTPMYGHVGPFNHLNYGQGPSVFEAYHQNSTSAVPMSPQSSQGGWASAASSDGIDQRGMMQSPTYRAPSPTLVVRSDGIRKKNARFEIPKERNLSNIDAMIQQSTDENEKKELKQQKRLLRNRQAALDSRQRKKTHTEKLEAEKKVSEKKMFDLEEGLAQLEGQFNMERDQWHTQQQQVEQYIQALQYERDEAIRQKTVETTKLRHQINLLKECVRDLERGQSKNYAPPSNMDNFNNDFGYALHNDWDDEFSLLGSNEFNPDDAEHSNRQSTPKPTQASVGTDSKSDGGFSGNTFYMCLLFGAFLAANWSNNTPANTTTSAIASSISSAEAGNVLKAVLKSTDTDVVSTQATRHPDNEAILLQAPSTADVDAVRSSTASTLDDLHQTLTAPSRRQELQAAFSLSASSYNHIVDPFNEHLNDGEATILESPKPSQFQQALANMQAQKEEMERQSGFGARLRERSLLWDHVPPQVVKDFQELVKNSKQTPGNCEEEKMEH